MSTKLTTSEIRKIKIAHLPAMKGYYTNYSKNIPKIELPPPIIKFKM